MIIRVVQILIIYRRNMGFERLNNLIKLCNDMKNKDICIYMYDFKYNGVNSTIVVDISKINCILLTFVVRDDLVIDASYSKNYLRFNLFNFINIFHCKFPQIDKNNVEEYDVKKKKFFNEIYLSINNQTPIIANINENNKYVIARELSKRDKHEGYIYCYSMLANGRNGQRSPYNSSLTKLMKPKLYERYKHDNNISFRYSNKQEDEKGWYEIINDYNGKRKA